MKRKRKTGRNRKRRRCLREPLEPRILLSGDGLGHDDLTPLLGQGLLEPLCMEAEADTLQVSLAPDDSQLQQPADRALDVDDSTLTSQAPSCQDSG